MVADAPSHVLVATDLSEPAALAVSRAAQLAGQHGAQLTALHVLEGPARADFTDSAHSAVTSHVTGLIDSGADAATVAIRRGRAAVEIATEAARTAADLVVVGAGGPRRVSEAFVGSTAENVARMSPVPVLIAKRPEPTRYRRVILAVDTTAESREFVTRLSETLTPRPQEVVVTAGHPPTRLAELSGSRSVDLIVVGTGARSPLSYAFLGSVAQHVMREARSDVLVVPAKPGDTPD